MEKLWLVLNGIMRVVLLLLGLLLTVLFAPVAGLTLLLMALLSAVAHRLQAE